MSKPPPSAPRFRARVAVFDEKHRRALEAAAAVALLPEERHMVLEDYLRISRVRRADPLPLVKLQLHLLEDLLIVEKTIAEYKERKRVRDASAAPPADAGARRDPESEIIERELHFNRAEQRAIRDIADGIAWRLFDHDRALLYELASRPSTKHIEFEGIEAELREFAHVFDTRKGIAVLNDLTHVLRIGDITIRSPSGEFEFVEVKKGHKTSGRITRQKHAMERAVAFFNTGERETPDGKLVISELDVSPECFVGNAERLMATARKDGVAVERVGDHLVFECTDFPRVVEVGFDAVRPRLDQARVSVDAWEQAGDFVVPFPSLDKYECARGYAPFSIYKLPDAFRVRLMTGAIGVVAYLNLSAVIRYLRQRGWDVVKSPEQHMDEAIATDKPHESSLLTVRKGPLTSALPPLLIGRLGFELLKPRSVVDILEATLKRGPSGAISNLNVLSGESMMWD